MFEVGLLTHQRPFRSDRKHLTGFMSVTGSHMDTLWTQHDTHTHTHMFRLAVQHTTSSCLKFCTEAARLMSLTSMASSLASEPFQLANYALRNP